MDCAITRLVYVMAWRWGGAGGLQAEEGWLVPERLAVTPGAKLTFSRQRVAVFSVEGSLANGGTAARGWAPSGKDLFAVQVGPSVGGEPFSVTVLRPGFVLLAVDGVLPVRDWPPEQGERRWREVAASGALRAEGKAQGGTRRWPEKEVRRALAFVRVGEPDSSDQSWRVGGGHGLEIIPERDPTVPRVGDILEVRVWAEGRPRREFVIDDVSWGETREHGVVPDEWGRAAAPLRRSTWWGLGWSEARSCDVRRRQRKAGRARR